MSSDREAVPESFTKDLWPCHWCGIEAVDWPSLSLHQRVSCRVLQHFRDVRALEVAERSAGHRFPAPQGIKRWFGT